MKNCLRKNERLAQFVRCFMQGRKASYEGKQEMPQISNAPWGREIALILIVKVMLIFAIWWVFFRTPEVPNAEQVSAALLASGSAIQQGVTAHDQH